MDGSVQTVPEHKFQLLSVAYEKIKESKNIYLTRQMHTTKKTYKTKKMQAKAYNLRL